MQIQENISLKPYNSFGIDASARYFAVFKSVADLQEILKAGVTSEEKLPQLILGGGSNILFTSDFNGIILKNEITGIEKIKEDDDHVYLKVGGGENWHQFVLFCIQNNYGGVENLSLIPGCVGASPMQNIGAYGVEVKEVFHELTAFHLHEQNNFTFRMSDCEFGYRDSIFKQRYKDQFAINFVTFRLNKKPTFNTKYGAIEQELESMQC
jgi:UDP-N-acetylmuramate dehydrogenase